MQRAHGVLIGVFRPAVKHLDVPALAGPRLGPYRMPPSPLALLGRQPRSSLTGAGGQWYFKAMAQSSDDERSKEDGATRGDEPSGSVERRREAREMLPDQTLRLGGEEVAALVQARAEMLLAKKGTLLIINGDQADIGRNAAVEDSVVIGREAWGAEKEGPRLGLRDGRSSRRHAAVTKGSDGYWLRDLSSTNGTLLNGRPVTTPQLLKSDDQISVGQTLIKFTLIDDTEAAYLDHMDRLAGTDSLTGLPAKHRFDSLLADAVKHALASCSPLAVLMLDLDNLKKINDRHGHHLGAHTISQVGRILGEVVAGRGEATRFGGDEFSAFLPGLTLDRALLVGERMRHEVERASFSTQGAVTQATVSVGVAVLTDGVTSGPALLAKADRALYRAKATRNTVST